MTRPLAQTAGQWAATLKRPRGQEQHPAVARVRSSVESTAAAYAAGDAPEDGGPRAIETAAGGRWRKIVERFAVVADAESHNPRVPRDQLNAVIGQDASKAAEELVADARPSLEKLAKSRAEARDALLPKREPVDIGTAAIIAQQIPTDPLLATALYRTADVRWRTVLEQHPGVLHKPDRARGPGRVVPLISDEVRLEVAMAEAPEPAVRKYQSLQRLYVQLTGIVNGYLGALGSPERLGGDE